ncbi:MAG: hypothetical protein GY849_22770 [Deltaproteobacteria bacterium]|nr:hypothetical protein [Deltaproteobacteria bacterium]
MIKSILLIVCSLVVLGGCATAKQQSDMPLTNYDQDTKYGIRENKSGFEIEIYYSRFQFFPESDAVATACKSQLLAIAWDYSDKAGKEIKPINEQRIRISMGRNGFTGITSCRAHAVAKWK